MVVDDAASAAHATTPPGAAAVPQALSDNEVAAITAIRTCQGATTTGCYARAVLDTQRGV